MKNISNSKYPLNDQQIQECNQNDLISNNCQTLNSFISHHLESQKKIRTKKDCEVYND